MATSEKAPPEPEAAEEPNDPRWIEYMLVDDVLKVFHPENPKGHSIDQLRRSMIRFGYTEAIMLDERSGLLASGHGRVSVLAADEKAKVSKIPDGVVVRDGRWYVPVQRGWSSVNDDELIAYVVAANHLVETGGWIDPTLAPILERLTQQTAAGLSGTGFDGGEYQRLLRRLDPSSADAPDSSPQLGNLSYQVILECDSEEHQREMIERFEQEGFTVRALIV